MFRQVHTSLWDEDWFDNFTVEAKLVYLHLVTSSRTNAAGFHAAPWKRIAQDTGMELTSVKAVIPILYPKVQVFDDVLWIVRLWKWQGGGRKWQTAVLRAMSAMPEPCQVAFTKEYPELQPLADTLSIPYPYTILQQNKTEPKQNQNQNRTEEPPTPLPPRQPLDERFQRLIQLREHCTGRVATGQDSDHIKDYLLHHTEEEIASAIRKAGEAKSLSWKYVDTCLEGDNNGRKTYAPKEHAQATQRVNPIWEPTEL